MGGHAVKLIGWGTSDAGEDYWVCCFFFFFAEGMLLGHHIIMCIVKR